MKLPKIRDAVVRLIRILCISTIVYLLGMAYGISWQFAAGITALIVYVLLMLIE